MSIKLTETQTTMLGAAARREDRHLTPPKGSWLTQARKAAARLLEAGLIREVKAKGDAPIWRRDKVAGRDYGLRLAAAGLNAITAVAAEFERCRGVQRPMGDALKPARAPEARPELARECAAGSSGSPAAGSHSLAPRAGSKIAAVIGMLSRAEGVTIDEVVAATGGLPHTTRAALTGLRKRGYALNSDRTDRTRGSIYRIAAALPSASSSGLVVVAETTIAGDEKRAAPPLTSRSRRRAARPDAVVAGSNGARRGWLLTYVR